MSLSKTFGRPFSTRQMPSEKCEHVLRPLRRNFGTRPRPITPSVQTPRRPTPSLQSPRCFPSGPPCCIDLQPLNPIETPVPSLGTGSKVRGATPIPAQDAGARCRAPSTCSHGREPAVRITVHNRRHLLGGVTRDALLLGPQLRSDFRRLRVHPACTAPGSLQNVPAPTRLHQRNGKV